MDAALVGIRGRLIMVKGAGRLVVSIDSIGQGVHFDVDLRDVKPIPQEKRVAATKSRAVRKIRGM